MEPDLQQRRAALVGESLGVDPISLSEINTRRADSSAGSLQPQSHITSNLPLLNIFFGVFNSYGILAVSFFMFLTAAIKRYINNDIIFVFVSGLTWALLIQSNVNPLTAGLPISLVVGILLSLILIKYDLLSTLLSFLLFRFFIKATELSFLTENSLKNEWYMLIALCFVLLVFGIILVFKTIQTFF